MWDFHREARASWGTLADACISVVLVLFGGTMSDLTLGLMSLDVVEMEVLQRSGTQKEQKQAGMISFLSLCHIFIRPHCFHCYVLFRYRWKSTRDSPLQPYTFITNIVLILKQP